MKGKIFLSLVGFFIAVQFQSHACTNLPDISKAVENAQEILLDDELDYKSLNKYEFIASKLGIIGSESGNLRAVMSRVCMSLKYPGMVASYLALLEAAKEDGFPFDLSAPGQIVLGGFVSAATYFLFDSLGNYLDKSDQTVAKLNDFIINWPSYKTGTPDQFCSLFEGLHMEYLNSGQTLTISNVFAREILKKVAVGYIESLVPEQTA